jgi:hypothetical protein
LYLDIGCHRWLVDLDFSLSFPLKPSFGSIPGSVPSKKNPEMLQSLPEFFKLCFVFSPHLLFLDVSKYLVGILIGLTNLGCILGDFVVSYILSSPLNFVIPFSIICSIYFTSNLIINSLTIYSLLPDLSF